MKIVLLHNAFGADARGGAETVVAMQAAGLAAKGHEVMVVVPGDVVSVERDPAGFVVRRITVPLPFVYRDLAGKSFVARMLWHFGNTFSRTVSAAVMSVIAEFGPDVVHTHNMMGLGYRTMREISKRWPHVHTAHDVQLVWPSGLLPAESRWGFWRKRACALYAIMMRRVIGSPRIVMCPSAFLLEFHRRYGFFEYSTSHVVLHPSPDVVVVDAREMPGTPTFLFVGSLELHKGIMLLIDVWDEIVRAAKKREDVPTLRIVGDGSLRAEITRRAAAMNRAVGVEKIVVVGRLGREALSQEYACALWTLVPSLVIENSPSVIAESFGAGTPIIASGIGGIPERVRDGVTGVLFQTGSWQALYKAVQWGMRISSGEWKKMSGAGQELMRDITVSRYVDEVVTLYNFVKGKQRE